MSIQRSPAARRQPIGGTPPNSVLAGAAWGLVSYRDGDGGPIRAGVLDPEGQVRALDEGADGMLTLLGRWEHVADALAELDVASLPIVRDAALDLAISYPPKIICAGANYYSHLKEMGLQPPEPGVYPYFFFKPPSTTLIRDGEPINIGGWEGAKVDWEAELAVVIGRRVSKVAREDAMDAVAGYVVCNDISDRSRIRRDPSQGPPFTFDWMAIKARDRSCPLGSAIIPTFLVDDPNDLAIRLWVNDELKQESNTNDLVFDIPTLIASASELVTLEPGDLIATGTPAGVGHPKETYLHPGDTVTLQIDGIGRLYNPVAD